MTGHGPPARAVLRRMRARQELQLAAALSRADRPMAAGWWSLLTVRALDAATSAGAAGAAPRGRVVAR